MAFRGLPKRASSMEARVKEELRWAMFSPHLPSARFLQ